MIPVSWKLVSEYDEGILGNILVRVRVAFLPDYPLVLSLLKHRSIEVYLNLKKWGIQTGKSP